MSRASLNTATVKHASLAEACEAAATTGSGAGGPGRDVVQAVGATQAVRPRPGPRPVVTPPSLPDFR